MVEILSFLRSRYSMIISQELYRAALRVVSEQFNEVVKSVDFLSCSPNQAVDLLNSDDLNVRTEVTVLQVCK